ncbi:hypothetical protein [Chengkuizengella sediminis]|uniref:hypothetical protein n=1 Tax=Chengkuizengella sediminis TaxID=1885917 RepID=UPI001389EF48|nr:hypothetical protein [Chengkuizengella sediminis]NDI36107.1 hypothetical protein [Chengkuizengella sediminis]
MKMRTYMIMLCIMILQGCGNQSSQYQLIASIQFTNQHLMIDNGDSFVWENSLITINDEYTYEMEYIPRGKTSIPYQMFLNEKGEVYQPSLLKVRNVEVIVPKFDGKNDAVYTW